MKKTAMKFLSTLLALVMVLGLMVPTAFATEENEPDAQAEAPAATFENIADDSGDIISLADEKTFQVKIPVAADAVSEEDLANIVWSLDWDKALTEELYLDPDMYPNHQSGGDITSKDAWHTVDQSAWSGIGEVSALFGGISTKLEAGCLVLTFSNDCYWGYDPSAPHDVGGEYMDVCGYYDLSAKLGDAVLGTVEDILVAPYDSYNTMQQIYAELDEMAAFAANNTDLYVEKFSMGQSSGDIYDPLDMPYLIIADDKASVADWLEFTEKAETDPAAVLADIAAGKYDGIKVPVMFSNIHANEVAATDGIMAFSWLLLHSAASEAGSAAYSTLTDFTAEGEAKLAEELDKYGVVIPDLVKDTASYLGFITDENYAQSYWGISPYSGVIDLEKYYVTADNTVDVDALLGDVFFILVPEENVEGRSYVTRTGSSGYDLNRDNSFQTTAETQNMQKLIGTFNPISLMEFHGRVEGFQVEPCTPPHEPNFEYDLLSEYLLHVGESFGNAAVASNDGYNSYTMPMRDYLYDNGDGTASWSVWDDMSTSYTPQFAMLHGSLAYTVELPAYNDDTVDAVCYGSLGLSDYIAGEKLAILANQVEIFQRGVNNENSNEKVNIWLSDQYDNEGAEADLWRPVFDGEGENGNFYPEFYIIPLDAKNQTNLDAAYDMMAWLSRNDVKILITGKDYTYDGITYPAGTMIISMYQAKRSIANGALYDGTFITSWTSLYSEGITTFNETRGFDMITVAKAGEIDKVLAACGDTMDYAASLKYIDKNKVSQFSGTKNADVIISNASEASASAVNQLLKDGKVVGMVTDEDSEFYGDFICSYKDYLTVADDYTLSATGISSYDDNYPSAKVITKAPSVYLTGAPTKSSYGFVYNNQVSNAYEWNYDKDALELMNFKITTELDNADIIVGASSASDAELDAALAGTPLIAFGGYAVPESYNWWGELIGSGCTALLDFGYETVGGMDCLTYVTYDSKNLINGSYVTDGDDMHYSYNDYGISFFSSIPEGADALVKVDGSKAPTEGFIPVDEYNAELMEAFLNGGILGFSYEGKAADGESDITVALFANSLTHKVHQRDEYAYISNFIFSNLLGEAYQATEVAPPTGDSFPAGLWICLMSLTALGAVVLFTTKKQHA